MSFFGFDSTLPRDRNQQSNSRGMFDSHDPFAGLSRGAQEEDDEVLDFEQTYDGLGQHLEESGDTFNDDTFGGDEPVTREAVGRDFDFAGKTANMRDTLLEEQALHHAREPMHFARAPQKPARTGYEAYKQPEYIPKLEADASIWGNAIGKKQAAPQQQQQQQGPKMMSLDEVEAMMRAQSRPMPPPQPAQDVHSQTLGLKNMLGLGGGAAPGPPPPQQQFEQRPPQILQRPQQPPQGPPQQFPDHLRHPSQGQFPPGNGNVRPMSQDFQGQPPQPMQMQRPPPGMPMGPPPPHMQGPPLGPMQHQQMGHQRGPSYNGPPITQAQQLSAMSPAEREAYLEEEAKRAKRNHKIYLLSKNNGLMTPQDKNFITRIQLQQLLTATGGVDNEPGSEEQLAEDFYYQVYAQIRGPPRSGPGQPLNQFAQTYLFQTGSRYGYGRSRHHPRGGDNHVQRMEQQVARAVQAAKDRPKNKSLVVEGSLGKIAFSNSKTPRPLLNIKRPENDSRMRQLPKPADRKTALRDIEHLYTTLMRLEDHERRIPDPPNEESPPDVIEGHMRWRSAMQELNQQLWEALKVMEPIQPK
jgi:DNA topoisomerase 2-associated protein PAT1